MPNTPNSNPSLAKKRKLPAEIDSASLNTFSLEFKSTERSGDNVEALNNQLYRKYCEVMNNSNLSTQKAISELQRRVTTCTYAYYYPAADIECMGIDSIREWFIFNSQVSMQPIKLDIQALKSFSSEIAKLFEYSVNVVQLNMISLKGRVFISKISCLHSKTPKPLSVDPGKIQNAGPSSSAFSEENPEHSIT